MTIRTATLEDLEAIVKMEYECFPETDAVPASVLEDRIRIFPGHFWLMLACKDRYIGYYEEFGFVNEGISDKSFHGGSRWNQMRLSL